MTVEEATANHQELKALHGVMRSRLLEMRDRKGWKALGYSSWEEYGQKEWGYERQYLNRLATASLIQSIVEPIGSKQILETHLRPLSQVPDDIKTQIWGQVSKEHEIVTRQQHKIRALFYLNQAGSGLVAFGNESNQIKENMAHGEFGKWIKDNIPMNHSQCNK